MRKWCGREDSNFHGLLTHSDLNAARLPIPPRPHARCRVYVTASRLNQALLPGIPEQRHSAHHSRHRRVSAVRLPVLEWAGDHHIR